jgi:hypothetical protein
MRVSEIEVIPGHAYCELRASVESELAPDAYGWFLPFTLWYRFPPWCEPFLDRDNGDPFLAALMLPAMAAGERLAIPAPISPRLLRQIQEIQSIHRCFDDRLHRSAIDAPAPETTRSVEPGTANGLFFSLGVDSFYSLLKHEREHPDDADTITHLITLHGFDVSMRAWVDEFPSKVLHNSERVAREMGKTLIPVTTNFRLATRPLARWDMSHGSALASVALALDGLLGRVLIAASTTYDQLYPWGSHPLLDPLWSTERLAVIHDGCEMGRIDKVGIVARSPLALETLKVCPGYNCGACIKCLPTIIDLMQAGALERCATLPNEIDIASLREVFRAFRGQLNVENYERRLANLPGANEPPGLRQALVDYLASEGHSASALPPSSGGDARPGTFPSRTPS